MHPSCTKESRLRTTAKECIGIRGCVCEPLPSPSTQIQFLKEELAKYVEATNVPQQQAVNIDAKVNELRERELRDAGQKDLKEARGEIDALKTRCEALMKLADDQKTEINEMKKAAKMVRKPSQVSNPPLPVRCVPIRTDHRPAGATATVPTPSGRATTPAARTIAPVTVIRTHYCTTHPHLHPCEPTDPSVMVICGGVTPTSAEKWVIQRVAHLDLPIAVGCLAALEGHGTHVVAPLAKGKCTMGGMRPPWSACKFRFFKCLPDTYAQFYHGCLTFNATTRKPHPCNTLYTPSPLPILRWRGVVREV